LSQISSLTKWYANNQELIFLFIISAIVYSFVYYYTPNARPDLDLFHEINHYSGWELWWDQGQYYKMSGEMVNGTFNGKDAFYPIGYPILGIPSLLLGSHDSVFSHHRFFLPDLMIYFFVVYTTFKLTYRLTESKKISILSLCFLFFLTPYFIWFMQPWNLHVVDIGIIGFFYILFRKKEDLTNRSLIIAGLLAGWIFSARFLDILWLVPMTIVFIIFNPKRIMVIAPGLVLITLVLFSNYVYFGSPTTMSYGYETALQDQSKDYDLYHKVGYNKFDLNIKIMANRSYCILIDPMHCLPPKIEDQRVNDYWYYGLFDKLPILSVTSWFLIFSPLGIYLLFKKYSTYQRWILLTLIFGFVMANVFYTADYAFNAGWTKFFRYQMFWLPLFTIFSIYGMTSIYYVIKSKIT